MSGVLKKLKSKLGNNMAVCLKLTGSAQLYVQLLPWSSGTNMLHQQCSPLCSPRHGERRTVR